MSRPGAIHRKIADLLRQHPQGLTSGQIRAKLNIAAHEQSQLDRRRRDLRRWFILERRQSGKEWVYILKGERLESALDRGINIRVRAAVLWRAHGRCQMCGRTVAQHGVVLVVDHKIPVEWGGSNEEENLWVTCQQCLKWQNNRTSAWAVARKTAQERMLGLLNARLGHWVAATWLRNVAGVADWGKPLRALRKCGFDIHVRRISDPDGGAVTYYRLCCPDE